VNKKLSQWLVVFFIAATLIIPTMVYANKNDKVSPLGAEDWVGLLNSEYGVYLSRWVTTRPVNSDGGYIKVCMSGVNVGNTITVNVFEKDVALKDTVKKEITFKGPKTGSSKKTCSENINVEKYVDGDFAEFFLKMKGNLETDTVRVYIVD
jgi:hypothetical protein